MTQLLEAGDRQAVSDNLIPQGPGGDNEFYGKTTGNFSSTVLALPDGNYVVAWVTPPNTDLPFFREIHFAVFSPSGALVDLDRVSPFLPSFGSGFTTTAPSLAAFDDVGFVMVMWDDSNSDEMPRAVYTVYDADYNRVARFAATPEAGVDPSSVHADVAVLDNDTFVGSFVADVINPGDPNDYTEIYTRDPAAPTGLISMGGGTPNATSVANLGAGYVYVWSEAGSEINAQIVNGGVPGAAFQINTTTAGDQWINDRSVAELAGGGFVVVWTDAGASADDPDGGVRMRVFDSSGNAVSSDVLINTSKLGQQSNPAVTALADGGFIVSYTSWQNGQVAVVAQRFDATGAKVGTETLIELGAHDGDVAVLANGDVVFTYTIDDGEGASSFDGRIYSERFSVGDAPAGFTLIGGAGDETLNGGAGGDELFGAGGRDALNGFDGNDDLRGGDGDDTLDGGNGDDLLVGGAGADAFYGGFGRDEISYHTANSGVEVDLLLNRGQSGEAAGDTFSGIENLIGSVFADQLYGDNENNFIYGLDGDDMLWGHAGDDILIGGVGADILTGGAGIDATSYHNSNSGVRVVLFQYIGRYGEAEGDQFGSIENIIGSPFQDEIFGDNAANELYGQQGADNLYGHTGNDMLDGGTGDDRLYGQDGNDLLIGAQGQDRLYGGTGADRFFFRAVGDSPTGTPDEIVDFTRAHGDKIDLSFIDANVNTGGDQAFSFIGAAAFSSTAGELRYAGNFLEADVNGDGAADFQVQLNVASLQSSDFFL